MGLEFNLEITVTIPRKVENWKGTVQFAETWMTNEALLHHSQK